MTWGLAIQRTSAYLFVFVDVPLCDEEEALGSVIHVLGSEIVCYCSVTL
jgi:hypothetical protein